MGYRGQNNRDDADRKRLKTWVESLGEFELWRYRIGYMLRMAGFIVIVAAVCAAASISLWAR